MRGSGGNERGRRPPSRSSLGDTEKVPAPSSAVNGMAPDLPQRAPVRHLGRRLAHGKLPTPQTLAIVVMS